MNTVNELWNQLSEVDKSKYRLTRTDTMHPTGSDIRYNQLKVDMIGFFYTPHEYDEWCIDMDTDAESLSAKKVKVLYISKDPNTYTVVVRDLDSNDPQSLIEVDGRRILPTTIESTDFKKIIDDCKFI